MVRWSFVFREMAQRPGRTFLTLLSIIIGVSALVSVRLATATTRGAYAQMLQSISGRAALQVVSATGVSIPEALLEDIRRVPGVAVAAPVIRRTAPFFFEGKKARAAVVGVVPEIEMRVRDITLVEGRMFQNANEVVLDDSFSRSFGPKPGDTIRVAMSTGVRDFRVVGLLRSQTAASAAQIGSAWVALPVAQLRFKSKEQLDSIDIVLTDDKLEAQVSARISENLPDGVRVQRPATHSHLAEETMMSAEHGLNMARAFSLLLAVFVIMNTFFMNVAERRRSLAIMRAIGATRRQVEGLLIREALLLGVIGTLIGIVAGWGIAWLLRNALGNMFQVTLPWLWWDAWAIGLALIFGPGIAYVGAYVPAWQAARISPLEGMSWAPPEHAESFSRPGLIVGIVTFIAGFAWLYATVIGWASLGHSVEGAIAMLVGLVFILPAALRPLTWLAAAISRRVAPVETNLARREVLRNRWRSALTIGVLFIASATGIGLASSVLDNINDVRQWYRTTVVGDFFVRAFVPDLATGTSADIPEQVGGELQQIPGIERITTGRLVSMRIQEKPVIVVVRDYKIPEEVNFDTNSADSHELWLRLTRGEVVIGTVLAQRLGLKTGDHVEVETEQGLVRLPIAAVANDYFAGGLAMHISRRLAEERFGVQGTDVYIIKSSSSQRQAVRAALEAVCQKHGLMLQSYADIATMIENMISGIVASLWGLMALGFLVASFGVINTLTMNVLEQTRQLGLLRVVAMTRRQVRLTVLIQALMMGVVGLIPGLAAGEAIAFLINYSTMSVTGHPVEFVIRPLLITGSLALAMAIVLVSSWAPAERAARIQLSTALQYQ